MADGHRCQLPLRRCPAGAAAPFAVTCGEADRQRSGRPCDPEGFQHHFQAETARGVKLEEQPGDQLSY